jgi:hypothetical protein
MMKALQIVSIIIVTLCSQQSEAQISFQKKYGVPANSDYGQSVVQASDSGYYVAGVRVSGTSTFIGEGILKRTDKYGNEIWTKYYSTPGSDDLTFDWIEKTSDGNLIVAGIVNYGVVNGESDYDAYLAKLDTAGNMIWEKHYGGPYRQRAGKVKETFDGGFILGGWNETTGYAISSFYMVRTNSTGDTLWTKSYTNGLQCYGLTVAQTTDSGFVVAGTLNHPTQFGTVPYVIKTNADGDTVWTKILVSLGQGAAYDIAAIPNNNIVVVGYSVTSCSQPYLCEVDEDGAITWQQTYTDGPCGWANAVIRTADNGYAVFGMDNASDYYLIKTDGSGDLMWFKKFHEGQSDYGYSVRQTLDAGYIMTGVTATTGAGIDMNLIKTGAEGEIVTMVPGIVKAREICVYPNPASNYISVTVPEEYKDKHLTISMYNMLGQQVICRKGYSSQAIDVSGVFPGLYHMSVAYKGEEISAKKIMVE